MIKMFEKSIRIRIENDLFEFLKRLALEHDTSMSNLIRDMIKALKNDLAFRQSILALKT